MKVLITYGQTLETRQYFCIQKVVRVSFNGSTFEIQYLNSDDFCRESKIFNYSDIIDLEVV